EGGGWGGWGRGGGGGGGGFGSPSLGFPVEVRPAAVAREANRRRGGPATCPRGGGKKRGLLPRIHLQVAFCPVRFSLTFRLLTFTRRRHGHVDGLHGEMPPPWL